MGKSENTTLETFDSGRVDTGRFREAAPGKGRNNNNNKRRQQQTDLHPSPLININAGSTPLPAVQQTGGVPAQETPDVVRFREPSFAEHIWPPVDAFAEPMPDSAVPAEISRDQSADASLGDEFASPAKVSPLQRLSPSLTDDDFEAVEDGRRTGTLVATALGLSLITLAVGSEVSERLSRWYNPPNPHAIDARHMMDSAISAADAVKRTVKEGVHDFADSARQAAHEARDQAHARPRQWMKRGAEFAERKARHARHEFVEKAKRGIRQGIDEAQPKLKQSDMSGRELRLESEERGRPHVMGQIGKNADRLDREPYKLHPSPDEIRRESEGRGRVGKHADRLDRGAYKARESLDAMRDRARGMFHDVKDTFKEGVQDLREDAESIIEQPQSFLGRIRQMFSTDATERRTAKRHHREHDFEEEFDHAKHYAESKMHDVKQRVESKVRGADSKLHEGKQRVESKVRGAQRQVEHTMRHGLDSTLDNARASVNEVASGAREVAGDIRDQVGEAAGVIHDFGESFVEQLGSVGESAGEFVEDIAGHVRYEASIAMDQLKGKLAKAEPQGWFGSLLNRFTGTRNAKATETAETQADESPLIPEREALDEETPEPIAGRHHGKFTRADDAAKPPKHTPVKPAPRGESQDAASELGHRLYSAASQAKAGMKEEANHFLDTWRRIVLGPDTPRWQVHHPQEEATESFKEEEEPASFTESVRDGVQHVREALLGTPNPEDVLGTRAFEQAQRQRPAREAVHDVRDKIRGAAHEAADQVRGAVRGNIRGAASQVRGAAEKVYGDARRRAHELRDDIQETEHEVLHGSISLAQSIRSHLDALAKYFSGELEPVCKPKASDAWKEQLARQHGSHTAADLTEQLKRNKESTIPKEEFVPAAKKKDVL